ncbi:MAG: lamin tail domain-containing protein [Anaerolineae bacterium]|jgi:LysM repeat protein|nr:lamin tail domain-containing protein [Anaerolineae bacterium]MDH7475490.1 lamin tail domain-containing protein [Anaerolineae bacterium]
MGSEVQGDPKEVGDGKGFPVRGHGWDYEEAQPRALEPVSAVRSMAAEYEEDYEGIQPRVQGRGITTRQAVFLIVVNAWISLLITLSVVLVVEWVRGKRGPVAVVERQATATLTAHVTAVTPASTPSSDMVIYVVEKGDTLSGIAEKFDVPATDIMRANGITDPNLIYEGQELIIPVGGLPTETSPLPTSTSPAALDTPTPGPLVSPVAVGQVRISDVLGRGDLAVEMVIIINGERPVRLKDWTLSDAQGHVFTFPDLFLGAGGSVRVHTGAGQNSVTDLYWGQTTAVWAESGDVATLRDASGGEVYVFQLP